MGKANGNLPVLSDRALNRATLARQGLLERQAVSVPQMLTHLLGLQGQVHKAPYIGLWSRLAAFDIADLETLLQERKVVRATMMRCTLHVATAKDFLAIRPLIDPLAMRGFRTNHLKPLGGADLDAIRAASRDLLDNATLSPAQLGARLKERWPELDPIALSMPARFLESVVHVPPAGLWGATKAPELTSAMRWLGEPATDVIGFDTLVLRYLRAFGPASGNDFGAWSGLTGGPAAMERLRPQLVSFAGEDGRELFDLPEAPRPDEASEAPVRLLPEYDNIVVGYADRRRMLQPEHFKGLSLANGMRPGFTVDGFVRGTWKLAITAESATIRFLRFETLLRKDEAALAQEAEALLAGFAPGRKREISFETMAEN
jgi:hypothetical protein